MELLQDYDYSLKYHPGKANIVADALSRKSIHVAQLMVREHKLLEDVHNVPIDVMSGLIASMEALTIESVTWKEVKFAQFEDEYLLSIREDVEEERESNFEIAADEILRYKGRICLPNDGDQLRKLMLDEAHRSKYTIC